MSTASESSGSNAKISDAKLLSQCHCVVAGCGFAQGIVVVIYCSLDSSSASNAVILGHSGLLARTKQQQQ